MCAGDGLVPAFQRRVVSIQRPGNVASLPFLFRPPLDDREGAVPIKNEVSFCGVWAILSPRGQVLSASRESPASNCVIPAQAGIQCHPPLPPCVVGYCVRFGYYARKNPVLRSPVTVTLECAGKAWAVKAAASRRNPKHGDAVCMNRFPSRLDTSSARALATRRPFLVGARRPGGGGSKLSVGLRVA